MRVNRLLAIITNSQNNQIYDARIESAYAVVINLAALINQPSQPIYVGSNLPLMLISNVDPSNIVEYSNLFVLYLTNYCLEINSNDLIKISSWLNNQWNSYLQSK
jgi:hypothetical protein